jgi:hypothetical protein
VPILQSIDIDDLESQGREGQGPQGDWGLVLRPISKEWMPQCDKDFAMNYTGETISLAQTILWALSDKPKVGEQIPRPM